MVANLYPVLFAVLAIFAVFIAALSYGAWSTLGIELREAPKP